MTFRKFICLSSLCSFGFLLSACQSWMHPDSQREARCKEIKSQLLLNSATSYQQQLWDQRSEQAKLNQTYHEECE